MDKTSTTRPAGPGAPLLEMSALVSGADIPVPDCVAWPLDYAAPSAWVEHVPFAFWLIDMMRPRRVVELGTHWGLSYFAFCQAVARLGVRAACFAIDHWRGDEHSGLYGEEVFEVVKAHNDKYYGSFSTLIRREFSEAQPLFRDGSIDLLHIDGYHTFDMVSRDFAQWQCKLSDRSVVLLHDTNVRDRGFGVYRLLEELGERHPSFEFYHGFGLGVVGVGRNQLPSLERLYATRDGKPAQRVRALFSRLGQERADDLRLHEKRNPEA